MVGTKHCCWGECKTDSRYADKWPKSLKELEESGKKVFIPFPKPSRDMAKCKRWLVACLREFFTEKNITRNTYICALHWPGEKGPTAEFPDPLKANLRPAQVSRARAPKRKAPKERENPASKKQKLFNDNYEEQLFNDITVSDDHDQESQEVEPTVDESSFIDEECVDEECAMIDTYTYVNPSGKLVSDQGSQTIYSKYELSAEVETMILKNDVSTTQLQGPKIVSTLSYENIVQDVALMKHFTGLRPSQFEVLHDFLDDVCPLETINYWKSKDCPAMENARTGPKADFSSREKLFICLLRLKRGFTLKTIAALLSTPNRKINFSYIGKIFTTYIQLMYVIFRDMQNFMFPDRAQFSRFLPKVFKTMKNIRCIVDCTEFRVECSRNFARQGNTFSSYKHTNTFKCLIAVTLSGGACFVSDLFEGDIDDVRTFKESGLLKHLKPYDLVLADRGFTVQDLLNPLQVQLKIPSFLKGR